MFDFRGERVIQSVDESLQRLGVEYIDVVQVCCNHIARKLQIRQQKTFGRSIRFTSGAIVNAMSLR